jgi:heme o synthase
VKYNTSTYQDLEVSSIGSTVNDYLQLIKMRLTSLVVLTAIGAYYLASSLETSLLSLVLLGVGGFGVAGASNALNQVLEKDYDKLMQRTMDRPLPTNRLLPANAVLFAGLLCVVGVTALSLFNSLAAFFGMLAFVLYAFVYTPLKRYSSAAVFVGAIAGAMPMLIGVVAFEGKLTTLGLILFAIQFAWQYPHFWAIGFMGFEDYSKAGYNFIPTNDNGLIDRKIGYSSIFFSSCLVLFPIGMYLFEFITLIGALSLLTISVIYLYYSVLFTKDFNMQSAKKLMFSSLMYIPLVLFILLIDKLI